MIESDRQISAFLDEVRKRASPGDYRTVISTDGDSLAFTPDVSASLWTTYRLPFGLTLGGGLQYASSAFLGRPDDALRIIPNGQFGKLPSYTVFNALLSYEATENIDLRLNIDNIGNRTYAAATNWNGSRATLGVPRSFLLSAGFRF